MKLLRVILILLLVADCSNPSKATVLTDWQTGTQILAPDDWKTSFTPPDYPGFGARSYDPKDLTSVDFTVDDQLTQAPIAEKSPFVQNFIKNVESQNSVVTDRSDQAINGRSFLVLSVSTKVASGTRYMTAWFTVVKGHTCQICLSQKNVSPNKSETLNKIIQSFTITDHISPHSTVLSKQEQLDKMQQDNPFNFYGTVIDENKQPVSGAAIKILVEGELENGHKDTEHDLLSDQNGAFKLEHVHSFGVNVTAAKDGYITVSNDRGVWFWLIGGAKPDSMPTKDHPAVFRLQKKGPAPAKALPL